MDLITIATKVAELILTKAIEQGGRRIGDLASDKVGNLISTIRNKFQKEEIEGKINKFEKDPNDKNKDNFIKELISQMEDDETFAEKIQEIINDKNIQSILSNIEAETITAKNITVEAEKSDESQQEILKDIKADELKAEDIKLQAKSSGNTKQEVIKNIKGKKIEASNINITTSSDESQKKSQ